MLDPQYRPRFEGDAVALCLELVQPHRDLQQDFDPYSCRGSHTVCDEDVLVGLRLVSFPDPPTLSSYFGGLLHRVHPALHSRNLVTRKVEMADEGDRSIKTRFDFQELIHDQRFQSLDPFSLVYREWGLQC